MTHDNLIILNLKFNSKLKIRLLLVPIRQSLGSKLNFTVTKLILKTAPGINIVTTLTNVITADAWGPWRALFLAMIQMLKNYVIIQLDRMSVNVKMGGSLN